MKPSTRPRAHSDEKNTRNLGLATGGAKVKLPMQFVLEQNLFHVQKEQNQVSCALEAGGEWHCPAIKFPGRQ